MRFARWVFWLAGGYGLVVLLPQLFLEERIGRDQPPPITHVEYFYGFTAVALAWQAAFLVIGSDPRRFRPLMLPAVLEKFGFAIVAAVLLAHGRIALPVAAFASVDLVLGVLFLAAYARLRRET